MRLGELVAGIVALPDGRLGPEGQDAPAAPGWAEAEIADLAYDSRRAGPGTLFCCVPGLQRDGHVFAAQAVRDGAVALLVERRLGLGVPEIVVESVRAAMGPLAARLNGDPTRRLQVVGVTGTNGKTTTAFIVRALLEAAGVQTGLLGTVTSVVGGEERPVQRTTPEAIDLQADFRAMLEGGDRACAMEVSSHALALGRTGGIAFAAAVFTNLTQDHLDFHPTMEAYFEAKRALFFTKPGVSVVNAGDPYGRRLAGEVEGAVTFGVESRADYEAAGLRCDASRCRFELRTPAGVRDVALPMPGRFNVANAVGALAAVRELGYELDTLVGALERGVRVPGRFEPVDAGRECRVIVDYAHTPDSLANVLKAAREITTGRVVCVFGAGGDRDRGKRPQMGEIAARLADVAVVTSDNPRSEDPEAIISEIVAGIPSAHTSTSTSTSTSAIADAGAAASPARAEVHVEADRRTAIEWAIERAGREDMVVIAGKGHEQGQELAGGRKVPFDDKRVAEEVLSTRTHDRAGPSEPVARVGR